MEGKEAVWGDNWAVLGCKIPSAEATLGLLNEVLVHDLVPITPSVGWSVSSSDIYLLEVELTTIYFAHSFLQKLI